MSGSARRAEKSVMVFPEPGGPHKTVMEGNDVHLTIRIIYTKNFRAVTVAKTAHNGSQEQTVYT